MHAEPLCERRGASHRCLPCRPTARMPLCAFLFPGRGLFVVEVCRGVLCPEGGVDVRRAQAFCVRKGGEEMCGVRRRFCVWKGGR